jgi:CRISPR/Cas system-associated exonuclease Cas4 (RecB family)
MAYYKKKLYDPKATEFFKVSRSKIDLFVQCSRCFYLDRRLGVSRPQGFPFNLNSAVDTLLKKEFDIHRAQKTPHPLMDTYGVEAVPFEHKMMDTWRDPFKGVEFFYEPANFVVFGGVDDVWQKNSEGADQGSGDLIVVDYKATSKDEKVNLDAEWQDGYKRQMEVYQWLLRKNGFKVSDTGYFVYANGRRDREAFDGKLEFDVTLIPYTGKDDWVEKILLEMKKCLDQEEVPKASPNCEYCSYINSVNQATK